jgi:hypothetical protein
LKKRAITVGDAEVLGKGHAQRLVRDLADRIQPARARARADDEVLLLAQQFVVVVAVDLRAGGEHQLRLPAEELTARSSRSKAAMLTASTLVGSASTR